MQENPSADAPTTAGCDADASTADNYNVPLHVAGIFIVLAISAAGTFGSLWLGLSPKSAHPRVALVVQLQWERTLSSLPRDHVSLPRGQHHKQNQQGPLYYLVMVIHENLASLQ